MDTNEGYVYFALDGEDFEPDDVTIALGVKPTSVKRKGERIPGKIPKMSSWQFSTPKIKNEAIDVYEMASEIIGVLEPKVEVINKMKERFNLSSRLEVVLWITTDDAQSTPAIGFDERCIDFLSKVGAYIDVDTYRNYES